MQTATYAQINAQLNQPLNLLSKPISPPCIDNDTDPSQPETITPVNIAWLWMAMAQAYGYKFVSNYGKNDDGVWFEGLKDLTPENLVQGFHRHLRSISELEREKGEAWPPNLKEFRMHCLPKPANNMPSAGKAFDEIYSYQTTANPCWSHPVIKEAAMYLDTEKYNGHKHRQFPEFKAIFDRLCQAYVQNQKSAQITTIGV